MRLRRKFTRSAPQIVVSFISPTNILCLLAARGTDIRVVISERNDPSRQSFGPIWDRLRRKLYRTADFVTANSHAAIETMRAYVPDSKLHFMPNPLLFDHLERPPGDFTEREPIILSVGRLEAQKRNELLIEAFASIHDRFPDWKLLFAGTGAKEDELALLTNALGVENKVRFLGYEADMAALYRRSALYVLTSSHEGTPNALLEAMYFGVPAIVPDNIPGATYLIKDGRNGTCFPAGDVAALADAITHSLSDRNRAEAMARTARADLGEYELSTVIKAWNRFLET